MSRWLVRIGLVLAVVGLLWPWRGRLGFGRLPGDIVIERGEFRFYFSILTCLVVSGIVSLIFWLLNRQRGQLRWNRGGCSRVHRRKVGANTDAVLDEVRRTGALPRKAAVSLANERGARRCELGDGTRGSDELRWINVPPDDRSQDARRGDEPGPCYR